MNLIDLLAIAVVLVFGWIGARSGALRQILGLTGAALAVALLIFAGPAIADFVRTAVPTIRGILDDLDTPIRAVLLLGLLLVCVAVGESVGSSIGAGLRARIAPDGEDGVMAGLIGRLDSFGGAVVGVAQALLLVWLVGGLLATGSPRALAREAQRSTVLRALSDVLPPPATIASVVARVLDETGAPNPFIGLERPPAPTVRGPSTAAARQIAATAARSTVKVTGTGCGGLEVGTGFAVSRGYVATNAHVVAGTRAIRVSTERGDQLSAQPVLFDSRLDIAVLWVRDLTLTPLRFASEVPDRGTLGAALGHPQGGPLTTIPAAVASTYRAEGLDIYDRSRVRRDIVELRAQLEPGDSGGPFVIADGTVAGVVFAESKSEETVGYALAPDDVEAAVTPVIGRTRAVSTGSCVR